MILFIYNFLMLGIQGPQGSAGPPPPPRPGYSPHGQQLPIDQDIWILVAAALILGAYVLYRRRTISKAS